MRSCPKGLNAHNFHQLPFVAFNRKDHLQHGFVEQSFGLPRVGLKQLFVPSCEGQVRAVQAGWGVSVLPELRVRELLASGELVNLAPTPSPPGRHAVLALLEPQFRRAGRAECGADRGRSAEPATAAAHEKAPPGRGSKRRVET
jgi:LysR family transcriptional regulator, chromosome initiation inhibitor